MPDSGVSSTTPPLAFGAGELVVGVGLFGVRLAELFGVRFFLGCLQLGWLGWLSWLRVVWSWLGWLG